MNRRSVEGAIEPTLCGSDGLGSKQETTPHQRLKSRATYAKQKGRTILHLKPLSCFILKNITSEAFSNGDILHPPKGFETQAKEGVLSLMKFILSMKACYLLNFSVVQLKVSSTLTFTSILLSKATYNKKENTI